MAQIDKKTLIKLSALIANEEGIKSDDKVAKRDLQGLRKALETKGFELKNQTITAIGLMTSARHDTCVLGVTFYSPKKTQTNLEKRKLHKVLAKFGFIAFADSAGPSVFAVSAADGKVHEFFHGSISDDDEKWVYVEEEKKPLSKENIAKSSIKRWQDSGSFAKDVIEENVIDHD